MRFLALQIESTIQIFWKQVYESNPQYKLTFTWHNLAWREHNQFLMQLIFLHVLTLLFRSFLQYSSLSFVANCLNVLILNSIVVLYFLNSCGLNFLCDVISFHLNVSFGFFLDYLHENVSSHLLSNMNPSIWIVMNSEFVDY